MAQLGIEAISRGAAWVTFIERDRRAQALIAENLALCRIENVYAIIRATVAGALDTLSEPSASASFDIVLLDPPYAPRIRGARMLNSVSRSLSDVGRSPCQDGVFRRRPFRDPAMTLMEIW